MRTDIGHTIKKTHHSPLTSKTNSAARQGGHLLDVKSLCHSLRDPEEVIFVKGEIQGERETLAQVLWRSTSESSAPSRSLAGHSLKYHRMARGRCAMDHTEPRVPLDSIVWSLWKKGVPFSKLGYGAQFCRSERLQ